jgi:molybdenum-dependent DNA-binding transcriptional regulator ModE
MNTDQKIIKNKVGLLNLAEMLGSVSQACKLMGYAVAARRFPYKREAPDR